MKTTQTILTTQIEPARIGGGSFLHNRKGFFFDPDNGANATGATNQGDQNQQQQQQQQQQAIEDPFKDIDMDLLDDATRTRITNARTTFATVAKQAGEARNFQSRYDQTQAELARLQKENEVRGQQSQQQQQQQQGPQTIEQDLEAYYITKGIDPKNAEQLAKLNAGAFEMFGNRLGSQIQHNLQPVIGSVVNNNASAAFESVRNNDRLGIFDIPDVAQRLYERTQQMADAGQMVNPEVVRNLGRIFWAEHCEANGTPSSSNQTQQRSNQMQGVPNITIPPQNQTQQTRYTYPGAGNHVTAPVNGGVTRGALPMDSDTAAAIAATISGWEVKPKAYRKQG